LESDVFVHYRVDLGKMGALDFLPDHSFDAVTDRADWTARLAATVGVIREIIVAKALPLDQATFQAYIQQARKAIDPEAWRIAWDQGNTITTKEAVALALG
jgi:hypothetical protein